MNFKRGIKRTALFATTNPVSAGVAGVVSTTLNPWKRENRKTSVSQKYNTVRCTAAAARSELDHEVVQERLLKDARESVAS
jgi:hypothetical protein